MYRGFKLESFSIKSTAFRSELLEIGDKLYSENKRICEQSLKDFISADNSLDGSKIISSWFPQVKAHVFISHSHDDEEMAKVLAGLLYKSFKIHSFVDSCVWGYAEQLLESIDNVYCQNEDGKTYNYHKRNYSTSHVHMMLATAISMMIDKTECLIFLNTPNSILPNRFIEKTQSPWLYYEIGVSQIVEKKIPERIINEGTRVFSKKEQFEKALKIEYEADLNHLNQMEVEILKRWLGEEGINTPQDALDKLYSLSPEKRYSNSLHG